MTERHMTVPDFWAHIGFLIAIVLVVVALFTGWPTGLLLVALIIMTVSVVVAAIEKPKRRR
ncbi:hypothetical protein ABZ565_09495 [Streptomyces sp. NPDC016469]|uniref:hypothetical protein n=1 Tax=Streptomyces sp. NPDC016469 TaxID=3157191 RepID=UPI0033C42A04